MFQRLFFPPTGADGFTIIPEAPAGYTDEQLILRMGEQGCDRDLAGYICEDKDARDQAVAIQQAVDRLCGDVDLAMMEYRFPGDAIDQVGARFGFRTAEGFYPSRMGADLGNTRGFGDDLPGSETYMPPAGPKEDLQESLDDTEDFIAQDRRAIENDQAELSCAAEDVVEAKTQLASDQECVAEDFESTVDDMDDLDVAISQNVLNGDEAEVELDKMDLSQAQDREIEARENLAADEASLDADQAEQDAIINQVVNGPDVSDDPDDYIEL